MVPIRADVVRRVPIDPTEVAEKNADPSVRGIGTDPFGFPWSGDRDEITTDIAGRKPGGSHAGDEHIGEVLANSDPILKSRKGRSCHIGRTGFVADGLMDVLIDRIEQNEAIEGWIPDRRQKGFELWVDGAVPRGA